MATMPFAERFGLALYLPAKEGFSFTHPGPGVWILIVAEQLRDSYRMDEKSRDSFSHPNSSLARDTD